MEPNALDRLESLAERRIRQATERGDFDDLPGTGEPLPDAGKPYDELWWVRRWLEREHSGNNEPIRKP